MYNSLVCPSASKKIFGPKAFGSQQCVFCFKSKFAIYGDTEQNHLGRNEVRTMCTVLDWGCRFTLFVNRSANTSPGFSRVSIADMQAAVLAFFSFTYFYVLFIAAFCFKVFKFNCFQKNLIDSQILV